MVFKKNRLIRISEIFLILFLIILFSTSIYAQAAKVGQKAEWEHPKKILMHTPGDEVFMGVLHPEAALYEKPFNLQIADAEHLKYIERLRKHGAEIFRVVDVLLKGTIDNQGRATLSPELDALRKFAGEFLEFDSSALEEPDKSRQKKYKKEILSQLTPYELVKIILQRPTIHLRQTDKNTGLSATYEVSPVMNLYFLRDQMITTKIIKFVLRKLEITPIYEVTGIGRLEGGDYFPAGEVAFIGQGLRTNAEGVKQLLEHRVFGTPLVAVVKDSWKNQEEMHLDSYFNIIGPKLAVMVDLRMNNFVKEPELNEISSKVDVYRLEKEGYRLIIKNMDFQQYLEKELEYTIIPVSRKDQNLYGINFLTVAPSKILAIDGVSKAYKDALKENGVDAVWMDFSELTKGYGAAHCITQVLLREDVSKTKTKNQ
ncbi:MAG: hypothetical protein JRE64_17795 [Deltaproteobacteria bacterium]|nr:hypothetical protein [Deltaproteobacteria bacterium]